MKHHLTYKDDKSDKFWNIEVSGASFTVTYGKTGTAGQTQTKTFDSEEECQKEAKKLLQEKLKKGYAEGTTQISIASSQVDFNEGLLIQKADKIAKRLTKLPAAAKKLTATDWPALYQDILIQFDKLWERLSKSRKKSLGGICICWDDCAVNGKEANKGWFAIVVEENQLEDLKELGSFEGGEKGITLKWDFVEILQHEPGGAEIFKQVINELCMPFIREALKASVNGKAFGKIKKMKPCHIFTARYHDEKPSYLLTVGKESKVPEKQNRFITRFIDENGNYWNDILESSRWKTKYKQQNHKDLLTQEDIGSFLMLCLDTYQTEPDNIVRLAERLPTSPETIKSQTLAWSIACYLVIAGKIPEAAAHMQRVEKNFMKKEFTNISYSYLHLKNFFACMSEKKKNYQSIAENWKNAQKQHPDLFGFIRRL